MKILKHNTRSLNVTSILTGESCKLDRYVDIFKFKVGVSISKPCDNKALQDTQVSPTGVIDLA